MSLESTEEGKEDIVYVDLTKYDGPLPPPPDYGLTDKQYERIKEIGKSKPLRGKWVWGLPLLALVFPSNLYSSFWPIGWFMNLLGYVFPILHVVRDIYANGQMAQVVIGVTLLGAVVYMPYNLKWFIYGVRTKLNLTRYSFFMYQQRNGYGGGAFRSPRSWRQIIVFFLPVAIILFLWVFACDVIGYVAIYVFQDPVVSVANWNLAFGGVLSGAGWLHGAIYSYVASGRPSGFALSKFGVLVQAYGVLVFFVAGISFPMIVYQFHSVGGILRWKSQLAIEEAYLTDKQVSKRKK